MNWGEGRLYYCVSVGNRQNTVEQLLAPDGADDIGYTVALIQYMKEHYPVDPERVYLSGFSNGAGQAQAVAMLHPELIAAICHIDSNWRESEMVPVNLQNRISICLVLRWRKERIRLPDAGMVYLWFPEISYPIYYHCSQQHQYDFWKAYNHIRIEETPDLSNLIRVDACAGADSAENPAFCQTSGTLL